jgi:hypothetical protein
MAVLDSARFAEATATSQPSRTFPTRDRAVWKLAGRELSVYTRLRCGDLKEATKYRMLLEVMILKEYYSSMLSNAASLLQRSTTSTIYVECLLLRVEGVEGANQRLFEHSMRSNILHYSTGDLAENITPLSLLFAVTCQCRGSYKIPFREADGVALQICIPKSSAKTRLHTDVGSSSLHFGGSVGMVSDICPSSGRRDISWSMEYATNEEINSPLGNSIASKLGMGEYSTYLYSYSRIFVEYEHDISVGYSSNMNMNIAFNIHIRRI